MKKKIILSSVIILAMIFQNIHAQVVSFQWLKESSGQSCNVGGESIETDNAGNFYVSGGDMLIGSGVGGCRNISKLDASGNLIWSVNFDGSSGQSIKIKLDQQGYLYATGTFTGTMDMDPGPDTFNITWGNNWECMFIAKYDTAGNFIWAQSLCENSPTNQYGRIWSLSLDVDNNSNVVIAGQIRGSVDFSPTINITTPTYAGTYLSNGFFAKYSPSGNLIFVKNLRSVLYQGYYGSSEIYSTDVTAGGDILVSGYYGGKVDFNPSNSVNNILNAESAAGFFAKYDNNGNFIFVKSLKGITPSYAAYGQCITSDANNIYLSGSFLDTIDFDPGPAKKNLISTPSVVNPNSAFVAKYDNAGNYVWAKKISSGGLSDECTSIVSDANGNVFAYGSLNLYKSVFFTKYNAAGVQQFFHQDFSFGYAGEIFPDNNNNFYISGRVAVGNQYGNDFDIGPGTTGLTNPPNGRAYFAKYHECTTCSTPIASVSNITSNSVKINWSIIDCAYKYQIKYWVSGSSTTTKNVYDPTVTKKLTGLSPSTTYQYQIRTQCDNSGYSPYSTIQTFTTNALREGYEIINSENEITSLNISPNPVNDELKITFQSETQNVNLQIINITGQVTYNSTSNVEDGNFNQTIDVSNLQSGIYLFKVFDKNNFVSKRFVKL